MFMDKRTEQAFAYLEKNEHSMMELLKNLVSIETPSADREANERIAAHLDTYCDALGMERQIHHFEKAGPTFAAWTRPQEKKPILLLGHMDTVHAVGKFGPEPFLVKDDRVYGHFLNLQTAALILQTLLQLIQLFFPEFFIFFHSLYCTFPYNHYFDFFTLQFFSNKFISFYIIIKLFLPELHPRLRHISILTSLMPVPKTSMYKNCRIIFF